MTEDNKKTITNFHGGFSQISRDLDGKYVHKVFGTQERGHLKTIVSGDLISELNAYSLVSHAGGKTLGCDLNTNFVSQSTVKLALRFPRCEHTLLSYMGKCMGVSMEERFKVSMKVFVDIGTTLLHMKKVGVLHRDINNTNILYDETSDSFVLIDYGIAVITPQFMGWNIPLHKVYRDIRTSSNAAVRQNYQVEMNKCKGSSNFKYHLGDDIPIKVGENRLYDEQDDLYLLAATCAKILWRNLNVQKKSIVNLVQEKEEIDDNPSNNLFMALLKQIMVPHANRPIIETCLETMNRCPRFSLDKVLDNTEGLRFRMCEMEPPEYIKKTYFYMASFEPSPQLFSLVMPLVDVIMNLREDVPLPTFSAAIKEESNLDDMTLYIRHVVLTSMTFIHQLFFSINNTFWVRLVKGKEWDKVVISTIRIEVLQSGIRRFIFPL